jgi:hypothetical protein
MNHDVIKNEPLFHASNRLANIQLANAAYFYELDENMIERNAMRPLGSKFDAQCNCNEAILSWLTQNFHLPYTRRELLETFLVYVKSETLKYFLKVRPVFIYYTLLKPIADKNNVSLNNIELLVIEAMHAAKIELQNAFSKSNGGRFLLKFVEKSDNNANPIDAEYEPPSMPEVLRELNTLATRWSGAKQTFDALLIDTALASWLHLYPEVSAQRSERAVTRNEPSALVDQVCRQATSGANLKILAPDGNVNFFDIESSERASMPKPVGAEPLVPSFSFKQKIVDSLASRMTVFARKILLKLPAIKMSASFDAKNSPTWAIETVSREKFIEIDWGEMATTVEDLLLYTLIYWQKVVCFNTYAKEFVAEHAPVLNAENMLVWRESKKPWSKNAVPMPKILKDLTIFGYRMLALRVQPMPLLTTSANKNSPPNLVQSTELLRDIEEIFTPNATIDKKVISSLSVWPVKLARIEYSSQEIASLSVDFGVGFYKLVLGGNSGDVVILMCASVRVNSKLSWTLNVEKLKYTVSSATPNKAALSNSNQLNTFLANRSRVSFMTLQKWSWLDASSDGDEASPDLLYDFYGAFKAPEKLDDAKFQLKILFKNKLDYVDFTFSKKK